MKSIGELDCIRCGYCCGYRREGKHGGKSYERKEDVPPGVIVVQDNWGFTIPVDDDGVCIYMEKLDNGFTRCKIHDKKPLMCNLHYCLTEKKVRYLKAIVEDLKAKCRR